MTNRDLAQLRLCQQQISKPAFKKPHDLVRWMGAVQAQDYYGALWAIGLRLRKATESDVEQAIADRTVVRTWPLRGTLHFVAAADVRWILQLLTPRVIARAARRFRQLELDDAVFARSKALFIKTLRGGKQLSRAAMYQTLEGAHISTAGQRGIHILWRLAQDGLLCFGAHEGKQPTFALLDEWAPNAKRMERDEALAELTRRYFTSHGPATLQDFMWWSGLPAADAKAGFEMAGPQLAHEVLQGKTYWLSPTAPKFEDEPSATYLLPAYDEYTVGYQDRRAVLDASDSKAVNAGGGVLNPVVVLDGRIVGTWKRALRKETVTIAANYFRPLRRSETRAVVTAADRYGAFLERKVVLV